MTTQQEMPTQSAPETEERAEKHEPRAVATVPAAADAGRQNSQRITVEQLAMLPDDERRANWINGMVEAELARQHYAYDKAMARDFAISGVFDDIRGQTSEQAIGAAMVKIQLGRSMGITAPDAMRYVYFTNGKPNVENELVAAKLQQAGYGWDPEFDYEEVADKGKRPWKKCVGCTLYLKKWDGATRTYKPMLDRKGNQVTQSFSLADAEHAQIWEKGKQIPLSDKFNYQSWPSDMYYWRCIARVKKYHAPHVLRGLRLKEEAFDVIPGDAPPEMQAQLAVAPQEAPAKPSAAATAREKVLNWQMPSAGQAEMELHPAEMEDQQLEAAEEKKKG